MWIIAQKPNDERSCQNHDHLRFFLDHWRAGYRMFHLCPVHNDDNRHWVYFQVFKDGSWQLNIKPSNYHPNHPGKSILWLYKDLNGENSVFELEIFGKTRYFPINSGVAQE